jgi:peptide/nickel transport system substrate-binding protein
MHRRRWKAPVAGLTVALLAVVSCAGDDDDDAGGGAGTVATPETEETGATADSGGSGSTAAPPGTDAPADDGPDASTPSGYHVGDEGEPVHGGTLVYGLEADTANGWAPYRSSLVTSGFIPISTVTDSLFAIDDDGELYPLLVESYEASDDYTEWTFTLREGIRFHDGTPLDGAAVKFNVDSTRASALTRAALTPIEEITASGQDVTFHLNGPWVALPGYFAYGSLGYMFSPTWLASLPDIPQRNPDSPVYDAELAATPADGNPAAPVGLGAFVFESYTPGNGNTFRAVRNEDYWRGPNGITGEDLPYLDAIEAVPAVDVESRVSTLRSGQFDAIHTANSDAIAQLLEDDDIEVSASTRYGETSYFQINVAEGELDPEGANADSPLLNVHCRRALAHAMDRQRMVEERGAGLVLAANGTYPPGSMGYLEDNGYPAYDLDLAAEELDTCLSELGTDRISFSMDTTNDPFNVETVELVKSMWAEAFGDQVEASTTPVEQGQYIGLILVGNYDAVQGRGYASRDPDQQRSGWHSESANPVGQLALNSMRINDPVIDEALDVARTNPDRAAREEAARTLNRRHAEQVYLWPWSWTMWGVATQPYVNGIERNVLPDGTQGIGLAFAGRHQVNQIWCDDGRCE